MSDTPSSPALRHVQESLPDRWGVLDICFLGEGVNALFLVTRDSLRVYQVRPDVDSPEWDLKHLRAWYQGKRAGESFLGFWWDQLFEPIWLELLKLDGVYVVPFDFL